MYSLQDAKSYGDFSSTDYERFYHVLNVFFVSLFLYVFIVFCNRVLRRLLHLWF